MSTLRLRQNYDIILGPDPDEISVTFHMAEVDPALVLKLSKKVAAAKPEACFVLLDGEDHNLAGQQFGSFDTYSQHAHTILKTVYSNLMNPDAPPVSSDTFIQFAHAISTLALAEGVNKLANGRDPEAGAPVPVKPEPDPPAEAAEAKAEESQAEPATA